MDLIVSLLKYQVCEYILYAKSSTKGLKNSTMIVSNWFASEDICEYFWINRSKYNSLDDRLKDICKNNLFSYRKYIHGRLYAQFVP